MFFRIPTCQLFRDNGPSPGCFYRPGIDGWYLLRLTGVPESGEMSEIKQAYKKLARKYHPDVSPAECLEENTKMFIELREAYETLSDPNRRASYDRHLRSDLHLAFSSKNQFRDKQVWDVMGGWRNQWESQVAELKRRSMEKELRRETSRAARMRKQNGGRR